MGFQMNYQQQRDRFEFAASMVVNFHLEPSGKNCLDVGCGVGNMMLALRKYGARKVTGIDIDLDYTGPTLIPEIAAEEGIDYSSCQRIQGDVGKCHFDEQFDLVTMYDVLEHVAQPLDLLQAISDVLKPGGQAFISTSPLYYSPVGHHCWGYFPRETSPWAHLADPDFLQKVTAWHPLSAAGYLGLNKLTVSDIMKIIDTLNFRVVEKNLYRVSERIDNHPMKARILSQVKNEEDLYIEGINLLIQKRPRSLLRATYALITRHGVIGTYAH